MTEKRFYLMNIEDSLHEYGRWCKPVLEDGETGKQYENALEVMDLLNEFNDENEKLKTQLMENNCDNCKYSEAIYADVECRKKGLTEWKSNCDEFKGDVE